MGGCKRLSGRARTRTRHPTPPAAPLRRTPPPHRTFYYSARTKNSQHVWQGDHCWYVRGQRECMIEYYTGSGSLGADPGETFTLRIRG